MNDDQAGVGGRFMTLNPPNSGTDSMAYCHVNDAPRQAPCNASSPYQVAARSMHTNGVNALFCDGSVHYIPNGINAQIWQALGTTTGGETIASNY
jgi:prepilin-type processing-associated H-X9-DG protein